MAAYRRVEHGDGHLWVVPNLRSLSPEDAKWVLLAQGFDVRVSGAGGRLVTGQDPAPGAVAPGQHGAHHGTVAIVTR